MAEKDFIIPVHLNDSNFCNGCDVLFKNEEHDGKLKCFCNYFEKELLFDVRRRVGRLKECIDKYGI